MSSVLIEPTTTFSQVVLQDIQDSNVPAGDMLFRVWSDSQYKTVRIASASTQTVLDNFNGYLARTSQDIDLLRSVIYWQKKTIDYQALHTAFLLNSISEEDFEMESEKFAVRQKEIQPALIASVIERMDSLIGIPFDTSDYSDFFKCSQENVVAGLRLLPQHNFVAMLPSPVAEE